MSLTADISTSTTLDLGPARALSCRECGHETPLAAEFACTECFGPLEVAYDFDDVTRASIEAGPKTNRRDPQLLPLAPTLPRHPHHPPRPPPPLQARRPGQGRG